MAAIHDVTTLDHGAEQTDESMTEVISRIRRFEKAQA
jgi:hypothetical protein